jgi:hypothetical protein
MQTGALGRDLLPLAELFADAALPTVEAALVAERQAGREDAAKAIEGLPVTTSKPYYELCSPVDYDSPDKRGDWGCDNYETCPGHRNGSSASMTSREEYAAAARGSSSSPQEQP